MPDLWGLAAIAAKLAFYLGVLTASGTVMAALVFRLDDLRKFTLLWAIIAAVASVLMFVLQGANLTGDASGLRDPEILGLLWSTPVGTSLVYRLMGCGILCVGLLIGRRGLWLALFGGLVALWSFLEVGHISGRDRLILDLALIVHLVVIAFWIGILTPLRRLASVPETYDQAAQIGHQFGRIAAVGVPGLILAGGYMGYALVGSIAALFGTGYGVALLGKTGLVCALLGLAAANKLRFVPALRSGDAGGANRLRTSISLEWVVIICILALTAVLTTSLTLPG